MLTAVAAFSALIALMIRYKNKIKNQIMYLVPFAKTFAEDFTRVTVPPEIPVVLISDGSHVWDYGGIVYVRTCCGHGTAERIDGGKSRYPRLCEFTKNQVSCTVASPGSYINYVLAATVGPNETQRGERDFAPALASTTTVSCSADVDVHDISTEQRANIVGVPHEITWFRWAWDKRSYIVWNIRLRTIKSHGS